MGRAADDFALPATLDGVRERINELKGDIAMIEAQLLDPERLMDRKWEKSARHARAAKIREKAFLETHRVRFEVERQAEIREQKRIEKERIQELQARRAAAIAAASNEVNLIRRLYASLSHLYHVTSVEVSETDRIVFDEAHAYLIDRGIFQ